MTIDPKNFLDAHLTSDAIKELRKWLMENPEIKEVGGKRMMESPELSQATKKLLERLMEKPELSQATQDYIFSEDRSEDFKAFAAGEEKGRKHGHEEGFAKGVAVTGLLALGALGIAGIYYCCTRDEEGAAGLLQSVF